MATRNRTILYRRYRDALKSVRAPAGSSPSSSGGGGGAVVEMSTTSLLKPNRSYAPLSTEDPGTSRYFDLIGVFTSMLSNVKLQYSFFSAFVFFCKYSNSVLG